MRLSQKGAEVLEKIDDPFFVLSKENFRGSDMKFKAYLNLGLYNKCRIKKFLLKGCKAAKIYRVSSMIHGN